MALSKFYVRFMMCSSVGEKFFRHYILKFIFVNFMCAASHMNFAWKNSFEAQLYVEIPWA